MFLTNIQSAKNRISSLQSIVNTLKVDLVIVNETHYKKNDKFMLEGFKCFNRNRQNSAMGGIATAVSEEHSTNTLKIAEGKSEEYLITRHGDFSPALNVINYYGKQETKQSVEQINEGWEQILEEIVKI